ncbi:hypothetical protein EGW08_000244 [Elysia chlorotica]|uniref:Essential protein Yae1 N-terminal domain-containing protein n=1 Tax=Elysia chlorotica TaxID=188477 RepID=A0A433UDV2_ELYCH|nr:hypothetical protein EGW08_000244 [Elysia chlorotica]
MTKPIPHQKDDIFHSVIMTEEESWSQGYSEGLEISRKKAFEEGHSLGTTKGAEIGQEIGFYSGYAAQILHLCVQDNLKPRVLKVCEAILQLADQFIEIDPTNELLTDNMAKIKSKFKQLTSLLGVQTEYVTMLGNDKRLSSF